MSDDTFRQSILDQEHLKLLSLGYVVSGGFAALFSLFGLLYVVMGILVSLTMSHDSGKVNEPPPAIVGWLIAGIGLAFFLVLIALALVKFWAARSISRRKSRTFCMVIAGISCLEFPYGTLLGVLTFIVLGRDSVARLFASPPPGPSAAP